MSITIANGITIGPGIDIGGTGAGFKGVYYNPTTGEFCYSTD